MHDTKLENEAAKQARQKFPADQFRCVNNVPVFAEHEREHGGETIDFGLERLTKIVNRNNHRIVESGSFSPLIEGHTTGDPKDGEKPALGFEGPYRLRRIGKDNPKWAICCDEYHKLKHADQLADLPRRSPELWVAGELEDCFDPVAALGGTTPKLDMGLAFRKEGEALKYSAPTVAAGANTFVPEQIKNQEEESEDMDLQHYVDAVMSTDLMKKLEALLPAIEGLVAEKGEGEEAAIGDDLLAPEAEPFAKEDGEDDEEKMDYEKNEEGDEMDEAHKEAKKDQYKRDAEDAKLKYTRLKRSHDELQKKHDGTEAKVQQILRDKTDEARQAILETTALSFAMNMEEEQKRCLYSQGSAMSDEGFAAHRQLIEGNYGKLPVHEDRLERAIRNSQVDPEFKSTPGPLPSKPAAGSKIADNPGGIGDRALADKIVKYAEEKGRAGEKITFAQAKAEVLAGNGQA